MLDLAREKASARGASGVRFEWADALSLPYDAGRFDAVTVGFGVRNLADLDRGLREMARVLRPGGRLVVLEITQPTRPPLSTFYSLWFDRDRAAPRRSLRRVGGLLLPAGVGAQLPRPAAPGGDDGRAPAWSRSAGPCSPGGSSRSTAASSGDPPLGRPAARSPRSSTLRAAGCRRGSARWRSCCASRVAATASCSAPTPARPWRRAASGCVRCWCCSAPARTAVRRRSRAAAAIELVHMATLVHDDVLDDAPLRRGQPTVAASAGRERAVAVGDLLFSRAFALLAEHGDTRAISLLAEASVALARGELAQRQRRLRHRDLRTALPRPLPAEDREAVRVRLPARPRRRRPRRLRRRDRPRVPAPRRRPRRLRPAGAHRQGARNRPARRHGHPAADRRRRDRSGNSATPTCALSTRPRPRRSATGSRRPARWTRSARARWRWSRRRKPSSSRAATSTRAAPAARPGRRRRRAALPLTAPASGSRRR